MARLFCLILAAWLVASCHGNDPQPGATTTREIGFSAQETFPGASGTAQGDVTGLLTLPPGDGPFPVVLMLHGCAGLYETHAEWAGLLASWGYASLRIDSFTPRGIAEICTDILRPVPRAADVNGAIAYLQALPEIDAGRIAVMGWSHGAGVALQIAAEPGSLRGDLKPAVKGAVALYPYCSRTSQPYRVPLLVLIGDADDWTPAGLCTDMVADLPPSSATVDLAVYPGATHSFDCRACNGAYWGHRLVHDASAHDDAIARVAAFLEATLGTP
jgi:dienelactone hydrolase